MLFLRKSIRMSCEKNCIATNNRKSVLLLEENEYVNFQNFERLTKAPFKTYGNLNVF